MALSDEQNAMLRLLAQGEQSYGDIAALMGLGEDEVRAKVVGALAQLEAEGKPAPDVPPPIAGGARPAAEVAAPEPEPVEELEEEDEGDAEPAVAEAVAPQEPVEPAEPSAKAKSTKAAKKPKAAKPKPKSSAAPKPAAAASTPAGGRSSGGSSSGARTITLPTGRGAWLLGGGIVAAIAVIVVVILLVSGGGGGSSSTATEGTTANANSETGTGTETGKAAGEGGTKELTQAQLTAVDGSEAKGVATFGRVKNKLALQIEATELEPSVAGTNSYTIWLAQSPKKMLPLASTTVKASGKGAKEIAAQFEVPVEVLAYLANGTFDQLEITRTKDEKFKATIETATKSKTTPTYFGEPVLRGTIIGPIIGLAKREEEEKKGE